MISNQAVAAEQDFRMIQRLFVVAGKKRSALTFAPVEQGNGSSWVVSRTGTVLANQFPRQKVCVVDADFRTPSQHRNFRIENKNGFAQVLADSGNVCAAAQQISGSNLWVLPAGNSSKDPYNLLMTEVLQEKLEELRKEFDHVLIDTPPMAVYSDALLVGRCTDGAVFVIGADSTRQETAIRARDDMQAANVRVLGAVLNKRTFPIPESLYQKL